MNGKAWTKRTRKGVTNKLHFHKVVDVLIEKGLNPTKELLLLIPELEPIEQAKIWMFLITYTQSRPPVEELKTVSGMAELADKVQLLSDEELIKAVRTTDVSVK